MARQHTQQSSFRIAIDGPAGAGKSTLAEELARALGFAHINTGIIYRALAFCLLYKAKDGAKPDLDSIRRDLEAEDLATYKLIGQFNPTLRDQSVFIDGADITAHLRTAEIDKLVGIVAKFPKARERVGEIQKALIEEHSIPGVVVEGRDIGTVIIPDAELKIFLVASVEVRAARRARETNSSDVHSIIKAIVERDELDRSREHSPLVRADGAVTIDNSHKSVEETVHEIRHIVASRKK